MNLVKPIAIAKNKVSLCIIVRNEFERPAQILASYLSKVTGASFEISNVTSVLPSLIFKTVDHGDNGFSYKIYDKDIIFEAANEKASIYAVYDFLERIVGCKYFTSTCEYVPSDANLEVYFKDYKFSPIIEYRELYYRDYFNAEFAQKHKLVTGGKHEEWGFWCHSFETLVSVTEYFDSHPEYFSLYEGERVGAHAQLCLSNPEVLDVLVKNLRKHMELNPKALYWSVSQNDNNAYCQCENCKKLDEIDGTPMGSVLTFVNKVATEFPDKIISTLAYWYTRKAPSITKPAKNVHIMLCNIEANRGQAIETDLRSNENKTELLEWKNICENVFLWDYCIQFRSLVSPFPNLRVLAPNIRFFVENNVRALFSQCNRDAFGEFSELRGYLLAKLMWDPYCNVEDVMTEFLNGYYKQAGHYIGEYINLLHDELEKSGGELSIFGAPMDCSETYFTKELFKKYSELFDKAEQAVAKDTEALFRVKTARMPIYYAAINLGYGSREELMDMIANFANQSRKIGLEKVEEWTITTDKFITDAIAKLQQ